MKIFGVTINKHTKREVLKDCKKIFNSSKKNSSLFIVTLNPEILLAAKRNPEYKKIINSANLKLVDGVGIKLISWLKKDSIGDRITGVSLAENLLKMANEKDLSTGIIYNPKGFSRKKEIQKSLKEFKNISLVSSENGDLSKLKINSLKKCKLILVATGHPSQEKLIYRKLIKLPNLKIVMGIGGTLDYWTKRKIRAPEILQAVGLEWFWRIIIQPNRFPRIFNAVIIFPILAILNNEKNARR